jgi:uncharacterized membrane protein
MIGIIGALAAAVFGFLDLLAIPAKTKAQRIALIHMTLNLTVVALYVVNVFVRSTNPDNIGLALALSVIAVALLGVSGWLGGKMVYEHGVAVDNGEAPATLHSTSAAPAARRSHI